MADVVLPVVTLTAAVVGVVLGAWLTRRNERQATSERLLTEALNDALASIAKVANGAGIEAQAEYASAMSRIALHGSVEVVQALRGFQSDATTVTQEGRARLVDAVNVARVSLGQAHIDESDLAILLFGPGPPPELLARSLAGEPSRALREPHSAPSSASGGFEGESKNAASRSS